MSLTPKLLLASAVVATMSPKTAEPLEPCPETPNCVSTQAERSRQRMEPIAFEGSPEAARERLLDILTKEPRARIAASDEREIRAVFTTRFLRFKDDVVFLIDPQERVIHFRSASRIGHSDMGVNRDRMERLTKLFQETEASSR